MSNAEVLHPAAFSNYLNLIVAPLFFFFFFSFEKNTHTMETASLLQKRKCISAAQRDNVTCNIQN